MSSYTATQLALLAEKLLLDSARLAIASLRISLLMNEPNDPVVVQAEHLLRDVIGPNKHGQRNTLSWPK